MLDLVRKCRFAPVGLEHAKVNGEMLIGFESAWSEW